jgi:hypothetical protein
MDEPISQLQKPKVTQTNDLQARCFSGNRPGMICLVTLVEISNPVTFQWDQQMAKATLGHPAGTGCLGTTVFSSYFPVIKKYAAHFLIAFPAHLFSL